MKRIVLLATLLLLRPACADVPVHLNVGPSDAAIWLEDAGSPTVIDVAGASVHVTRLLPQHGMVQIPHPERPHMLYLTHARYETAALEIPGRALQAGVTWPPQAVCLSPRYGPFSNLGFDMLFGAAISMGLGLLWRRARRNRDRRHGEQALVRGLLSMDEGNAQVDSVLLGEHGGQYMLGRQIGKGGMGTVHEAIRSGDMAPLAIKLLSQGRCEEEASRERFRREALSCARVRHPGVVSVLDFGLSGQVPFIVMERVHGETLRQMLNRARAPLPPPRVVGWLRQILEGLRVVHEAGIIHRDIKPENLMVTESDAVKLLDFGVARVIGLPSLTPTGAPIGTPLYMAPEHLQGHLVGPAADLYSLGVVTYELLSGKLPYDCEDPDLLVARFAWGRVVPLCDLAAEVPQALARIVMRMLAPVADHRYATCDEVLTDLQAAAV
ncbi:MAG: serine/threonine-protein kinase [Candidatus Xenobia bacterium]